jgi:RND superfamily putative drug exporter
MASITRWVLAHKRTVVAFWVVLTLVGMASAGWATKALKQKASVPGKEGWVTNQQIAHDFHGTGGNGAPLVPVATLPAGLLVSSPGVVSELRALERRLEAVLPGAGWRAMRAPEARRSSRLRDVEQLMRLATELRLGAIE